MILSINSLSLSLSLSLSVIYTFSWKYISISSHIVVGPLFNITSIHKSYILVY